ncbi:MAG: LysE family transporter [Leptolyngbyaceae cyanobacterium T60_A2020_046]|nr:LysE family transporter [Leptolyngbyaceae cyanobacterium T60_A2020_046]
MAGFGLTAIAGLFTDHAFGLRIIGGLFLCYLGVTTILAKPQPITPTRNPKSDAAPVDRSVAIPSARSLFSAYTSTLTLTLTNLATIFSFAAIFTGLGIVESGQNYAKSGVLVLGVFLGSAFWWLFLSGMVNLLRTQITPTQMQWLNKGSGTIIFAFGVVALAVSP